MIKVSVIIPAYNAEKHLNRTLNSVISQSLKDIEIICINDGSTDKTLEILKEFARKDSRIVIIDQENKGVSAARNAALKIAKGEFIGFVDSDDTIDEKFYEKLYSAAVKNNCDIAIANIKSNGAKKNKHLLNIVNKQIYRTTIEKYKAAKIEKYAQAWNKIYKREVLIKKNIFFEKNVIYEDLMFSHRALHESGALITVPNTYYNYIYNSNSITAAPTPKKLNDFKNQIRKTLAYIKEQKINVPLKNYHEVNKTYISFLGINFIQIKDWEFFKIYYLFKIPIIKIEVKF